MVGLYPDAPGLRMAWDRDGSVAAALNLTTVTVIYVCNSAQRADLNSEHLGPENFGTYGVQVDVLNGQTGAMGILFPELRNLVARYADVYPIGANNQDFQWSPNTTNLLDGTWNTLAFLDRTASRIDMRSPDAFVQAGVKGVRWTYFRGGGTGWCRYDTLHLYGDIAAGETPNRLRFWQTAVDAEVAPAHFDLGDIQQGTQQNIAFRIKNNSPTQTAQSVAVSAEALSDTTPSNVGQHTFSTDGVIYTPTINIGDLAPGAISPILYMRRQTSPSATFGLWWTRFIASAASWV